MFSVAIEHTQGVYPTICKFWNSWSFPIIPIENLPKMCAVCSYDNIPIYAVFIYRTDSSLCWLGFPCSDKNISYKLKKGGLEVLVKETIQYCKNIGCKLIVTTTNSNSFGNALENSGFHLGDTNTNHYTLQLWEQ